MDVQLYVYDLSKGLARQFSQQFLGTYIDAVYHTSIVFEGIEYFYGAGVQTAYAGSTHHGQPMEKIELGRTDLPLEVVLEYLDSLKQIYTMESYDLFLHNCNNFSNDFAMFLVGKGIPTHITSLPQTVLNTPFGQMLKPQLDAAMRPITQAPVPPSQQPASAPFQPAASQAGKVQNITDLRKLKSVLASAADSCAVIFFTSSTCAPCKLCYPVYDELAEEAQGKAVLIKVDINFARETANEYGVRATPTFMTFLKGDKEEEWAGADSKRLESTVRLLINSAHPPHPHQLLKMPKFLSASLRPITYSKLPPMDKVVAKLGPLRTDPAVQEMRSFIEAVHGTTPLKDAPVPSLPTFASIIGHSISTIPPNDLFAIYDLFRLAIIDPRVGAYFAEEKAPTTIETLLSHVNELGDKAPYNLRITSIHIACNIFSSRLAGHVVLSKPAIVKEIICLATASLLDEGHSNGRISAASLSFNVAVTNYRSRMEKNVEILDESQQVELVAGILEALAQEENKEAVEGLILGLGLLVYCAPWDGELLDLCRAMEAGSLVRSKSSLLGGNAAAVEVGTELLSKGLDQ